MKKSVKKNVQLQPKLIFLLGVLTGAITIGLIFFYSSMSPNQYESAVLQSTRSTLQLSPTRTTTTTTVLTSPTVNTYSYSALPTPTGN